MLNAQWLHCRAKQKCNSNLRSGFMEQRVPGGSRIGLRTGRQPSHAACKQVREHAAVA